MEGQRIAAEQAAQQQAAAAAAEKMARAAERVRLANCMELGRTAFAKRQKVYDAISPLAPPLMLKRDTTGGCQLFARE